ncbi:unnamed protein product [Boreogadus saida]
MGSAQSTIRQIDAGAAEKSVRQPGLGLQYLPPLPPRGPGGAAVGRRTSWRLKGHPWRSAAALVNLR